MSNLSIPSGRLSTPYTDGAYRVYSNSLLFKSGDYSDKGYSMDNAEIAAAASAFTPVSVNLEHAPAMLVGKLGEVRAAYVDASDPSTLRGVVAIPTWLDDQLTDAERQVSSEFNRETKRLVGLALTPSPRVEGAALMAAFNTASAGEGGDKSGGRTTDRSKSMDVLDEIKALLAGFNKTRKADEEKAATDQLKAELDTVKAELAEFKKTKPDDKKTATFSEADAKSKAGEFVSELLAAHKCLPAEREGIESGFIASFRADCAVASFSGDVLNTPTVEAFKASQRARPAHLLTAELMADVHPDAVLFAYGKDGKTMPKPKTPAEVMDHHNKPHRMAVGARN